MQHLLSHMAHITASLIGRGNSLLKLDYKEPHCIVIKYLIKVAQEFRTSSKTASDDIV